MDLFRIHTMLVIPGNKPQWEKRARECRPDLLIWDLEDGVPNEDKGTALRWVESRVQRGDAVRLNPIGTRWYRNEVERLAGKVDLVFMPKYEGHDWDGEVPPWGLVPIIETPLAVLNAEDLALDTGVVALSFGHADLSSYFCRGIPDLYHPMVAHARFHTLMVGKSLGIPVWHGPSLCVGEGRAEAADKLAQECAYLGFGGIVCVHPDQVMASHSAWTSTLEELSLACGISILASPGGMQVYQGTLLAPGNVRAISSLIPSPSPLPSPLPSPRTPSPSFASIESRPNLPVVVTSPG